MPLSALVQSAGLGLVVGLSGALAPGPTLLATISGAVRGGPFVGARVAAGHLIVEGGLALALVFGLATVVLDHTAAIALIGGIALIGFGLLTLQGAATASLAIEGAPPSEIGPVLAGILTSVANPYFWIWWVTIGGALLASALATGPAVAVSFLGGHAAADLGWLLLVGICVHRGRRVLPDRGYRLVLYGCGAFLIVFGAGYLASVVV